MISWQLFRYVGKYQYIQLIPICNGLFIRFRELAQAQGFKPEMDGGPTITPPFIGSQKNLMIDLKIILLTLKL